MLFCRSESSPFVLNAAETASDKNSMNGHTVNHCEPPQICTAAVSSHALVNKMALHLPIHLAIWKADRWDVGRAGLVGAVEPFSEIYRHLYTRKAERA
jgi:hypothetical protein